VSAGRRRLPFEVVEQRVRAETTCELARRLGVDRQNVYRWRQRGLTVYAADQIAAHIGTHAGELWPAEWCAL